jgi:hypothetical protein
MNPEEDWEVEPDEDGAQRGGIGSIEGDRVIGITDPRGSVTVIDRLSFYLQSGAAGAESGIGPPGRIPRFVPKDILADLRARFVTPGGFETVVERLRQPGTVVLSGKRGNGKRSAALMALASSGNGSDRFRELPDDERDGPLILDPEAIEEGERLLLDLSAGSEEPASAVIRTLRSYRAVVAERGAYLVIVLSQEIKHVAEQLGTSVAEIDRPDGKEVFRKHLQALDVPVQTAELNGEPLAGRLAYDPMRELAALAELVWRNRVATRRQGSWQDWLGPALEGSEAQLDAVAKLLRDNRDGRTRALLLATAVFEYSTPDIVSHGTTTLLDVVGYPQPETHRLDRADIAESLRDITAKIDRDRRVRFGTVTYGHAVRTHFWTTFPELRGDLRKWIDRSLRAREVPGRDRVEALLRYAEQCLVTDYPADLCQLAESWARQSPKNVGYLLDAAGPALTRGLLHEQYGRFFRRQVYEWSVNRTLWPSLGTLLIGLCAGVIAPVQPEQALVRLRHFTRHRSTEVVAAARAALSDLAADSRFARRLLDRVHSDLTGERPHPVDYELFMDVAEPSKLMYPLIANSHVRALLASGWRVWLEHQPDQRCADAIRPWLAAHAEQPHREQLLDILVLATVDRPHLGAVLYAAVRDWVAAATDQPDRQARLRTAALIQRKSSTTELSPPKEGITL